MTLFRNPYQPVGRKVDPLDDLARQRGMPSAPANANAPTSTTAPGSLTNQGPIAPPSPSSLASAAGSARQLGGNLGSLAGGAGGGGGGGSRDGALDSLQQQHDAETKATEQQLAASRAQQLQDAASRSNLGGFGLSGAATGLQNDTANAADRNATLALADLSTKQHNEDFQAIQRQAALDDLEASENLDLNHDGKVAGVKAAGSIGDGNPGDFNPTAPGTTTKKAVDSTGKVVDQTINNAPVTDSQRIDITGEHLDLSHVKDGAFAKGSQYFGSDANYDYYADSSGNFYRVHR